MMTEAWGELDLLLPECYLCFGVLYVSVKQMCSVFDKKSLFGLKFETSPKTVP